MKKILVIEDEANIRESLVELLEMKGYDTVEAENGRKGVELALKDKPDLILCDIMMPEMSGHEVITALRKEKGYTTVPFIFLTALSQRTDLRKGMNLGADDYLSKPFKAQELYETIETRLSIQAKREEETESTGPDPLQQKVINETIKSPIQGLKTSSELLLNHFNDYAEDEIVAFIKKLNASLSKIERSVQNLVATQAIEISNHNESTLQGLVAGVTKNVEDNVKSILLETALSCNRETDIFLTAMPKVTIGLPQNTFKMVVSELIYNAFKFSKKDTLVTIHGKESNGLFELTIKDEGRGMSADLLNEVNASEVPKHPNSSKYGLYMVRSLLERSNNTIRFMSERGKGTTAILSFKIS